MNDGRWTIRDVISTVLISMLMIVIQIAINLVCMPNDFVSMVLSTSFSAFACGVVYVLLATRVGKHGCTLIYATMVGIVYLISGNWYLTPWFILVGVISELILIKKDAYQDTRKVIASWSVNGLLHQGTNFLPILFFWDTYYAFAMKSGMEQSYVNAYLHYYTDPFWITFIVIFTLVLAFLGAVVGTRLVRVHFKKAGVL